MTSNSKLLGYSTILISAALMGLVGLFARNINTSGDVIAFTRMLVGGLGIGIVLLVTGKHYLLRQTRLSPAVIFSGVCLGLCLAGYVSATKYTTLANAVFLIYTGPIFSTILAAVILKEKIDKLTAILLGAVIIGTLMILGLISWNAETGFTVSLSFSGETFFGDMLGLASGVGFGLYLFLSRYRTDVPADSRAFFNFLFGAIAIALTFIVNPPDLSAMDIRSWSWLIAMGIFIGFGALGLLAIAARHLKAAELACVSYLECVVGAAIGILVFNETMTAFQAVGGLLIIIGGLGRVVESALMASKQPSLASAS